MNWFGNRVKEPSSWGGMALILLAVASFFEEVGGAVAEGTPWYVAAALGVGGLVQAIRKDPNNGMD